MSERSINKDSIPDGPKTSCPEILQGSTEISMATLSDLIENLDGDNKSAYEEDINESQNSKNRHDVLPVDPKSLENGNSNGSVELRGESVFVGGETGKPNRNIETNNFEKSSNIFQSALANSANIVPTDEKYSEQTSSKIMDRISGSCVQFESNDDLEKDSEMESRKNEDSKDTEEKFEESKSDHTEHVTIQQEQNVDDYEMESEVDSVREINLYAHNLDIYGEDYPEVENVWPDLYPYEKTKEIPVKELKSFELKGSFTKYFKLELSNEFIVVKVTSGSNVLVNAVKYKVSDSKHTVSGENKPIHNSSANYDSGKANEDVPAIVNLISNDRGFQDKNLFSNSYVSLEETDIKKGESSLSSEERLIDSFENSATGNDLHVCEAEVTKDSFPNIDRASEGGNFESHDIQSIASENEEVDCAPTRVRTLKAIPGLTKDSNVPSLYSGITSPIERFFSKQKLGSNSKK